MFEMEIVHDLLTPIANFDSSKIRACLNWATRQKSDRVAIVLVTLFMKGSDSSESRYPLEKYTPMTELDACIPSA